MTEGEQVGIAAVLLAVSQEGSVVVSLFDPKHVLVYGLPQLFHMVLRLFRIQTKKEVTFVFWVVIRMNGTI